MSVPPVKNIPTSFFILLTGELRELAKTFRLYWDYTEGEFSFTKWGAKKDREKYLPIMEEARTKLKEALDICYPEFKGRFSQIIKSGGAHDLSFYVEVFKKDIK